jgi:acyl-CoA synthetase (AMP-forming)/AMP-acid ligase II
MFAAADSDSGRTAIVDPPASIEYGALAARTLGFAEALDAAGVRPDERVAIMLPRGADAAAAFFGILAVGGIAVFVNESLRPRQIEHVLRHSSASALVTSDALFERQHRRPDTSAFVVDVNDVPASGTFEPVRRVGDDVAQIIYTSGSTGLPKGVVISHFNLWGGMQAVVDYLGIRPDDRIASLLPFSFDYGLNQLFVCVGTGAALVVERSPVPHRIVQKLRKEAVTVLPAVPPLWMQLLGVTTFEQEPLPDLRILTNTGGRLPTDAVRRLRTSQPQASLVLVDRAGPGRPVNSSTADRPSRSATGTIRTRPDRYFGRTRFAPRVRPHRNGWCSPEISFIATKKATSTSSVAGTG